MRSVSAGHYVLGTEGLALLSWVPPALRVVSGTVLWSQDHPRNRHYEGNCY